MTRHQYTQNIHKQLQALNERIDYKIMHGQSYADDSRRHKTLLRQIARQSKQGFLARLFPSLA